MTCKEFVEFLWRYHARELCDDERFEFDAHLAVCPNCVAYLNTYGETVRLGKEAFADPEADVPDEVPEELVQAILAAAAKRKK